MHDMKKIFAYMRICRKQAVCMETPYIAQVYLMLVWPLLANFRLFPLPQLQVFFLPF
jgi:hypothetical protein